MMTFNKSFEKYAQMIFASNSSFGVRVSQLNRYEPKDYKLRSHKTLITIFLAMLFTVNSVHAQEDILSALKTEKCKKIGQATATVVSLRDGGADEVGVRAVMDVGLAKDDPAQEQLAQIIKDTFQFRELTLHSHRMYRWVSCANSTIGKSTKSLEVLAPELKQCQALKNPQTQVNCMSSVVSGS